MLRSNENHEARLSDFTLAQRGEAPTMRSVGTEFLDPIAPNTLKGTAMKWTTPAATDLRFGFEVTMYIAAR